MAVTRYGSLDSQDVLVAVDEIAAAFNTVQAAQAVDDAKASTVTIALAASATTDGMDITITVKDTNGDTVAAVQPLEVWISEAATGIGLTADATGTLTVPGGSFLTEYTDDKHASIVTAATGIATLLLVDSNNPTDQYVVVKRPDGNGVVVSAASGTNWEGV